MKIVLAAVIAVGLLSVAATLVVGSRVREDTVVKDPYEAGLRWDAEHPHHAEAPCDLAAARCAAAAGPLRIALDLGPRPLRAMRELQVSAEVREGGVPVERAEVSVAFSMPGMVMGENRAALAPAGPGRFAGKAVLVRCPSGRGDWRAEVTVRRPGAPPATAGFALGGIR